MAREFSEPKILSYESVTDLVAGVSRRFLGSSGPNDPDFPVRIRGTRLTRPLLFWVRDLAAEPFSISYGYHLPEMRWKKFCRTYLPSTFLDWLALIRHPGQRGEVALRFFDHEEDRHSISPCLTYLSFGLNPNPHLTLVSRAAVLAPQGLTDLALMSLIAQDLAQTFPGPISLSWFTPDFQFSPRTSLTLLEHFGLADPDNRWLEFLHRGDKLLETNWGMYYRAATLRLKYEKQAFTDLYYPTGIWLQGTRAFFPLGPQQFPDSP